MTLKRRQLFWLSPLCLLLLSLLLTACGGSGDPSTGGINDTPTTTAPTFQLYSNEGFTLNTPVDWKLDESHASDKQYQWQREDGKAGLLVRYGENDMNAEELVKSGLTTLKNNTQQYQDQSIDAQATYHGYTWTQGAATADDSKWVILALKDPDNAKKYLVVLTFAPINDYDAIFNSTLKPMLDSLSLSKSTHA